MDHRPINPDTLFHLVPKNLFAKGALYQKDNNRYASQSGDGQLGLEVGFHVPANLYSCGIITLGTHGDLMLTSRWDSFLFVTGLRLLTIPPFSTARDVIVRIHAAFEYDTESHLIFLVDLSGPAAGSPVRLGEHSDFGNISPPPPITQPKHITYGIEYTVWVASLEFKLVWRTLSGEIGANSNLLAQLALDSYKRFKARRKRARSPDCPTEPETQEFDSQDSTPLRSTKKPRLDDVVELHQELTGADESAFGVIYQTVDMHTGRVVVLKKVASTCDVGSLPHVRVAATADFTFHPSEPLTIGNRNTSSNCLGCHGLETMDPEIFLPFCDGSLEGLLPNPEARAGVYKALSQQMLSALDYLHHKKFIHRNIKPDNIFFSHLPGINQFLFQLADFGLGLSHPSADYTAGYCTYFAPESVPEVSGIDEPQSHKSDIWSLAATLLAWLGRFPPPQISTDPYQQALSNFHAVLSEAEVCHVIKAMAKKHPDERPIAAQLLIRFFDGRGLTPRLQPLLAINPLAGQGAFGRGP
ncbi:STE protein kinase [Gaeumannomyces tritici R3-111a-1]|uniref:non-specific serine/threonine protein kinase n=1 Tax=Gaeumannomyces tritici (strain R3-111a-1) TaxID=644352 RepID=J3NSW8_GAET3|nr:STE protein kinase [Gaeumannomyces tritici R3-111a-1]EJT79281.1 STE protein kinase [Gaeumannomyces tritici R3-111a-1]